MRIVPVLVLSVAVTGCALIPNPFAKYSRSMVEDLETLVRAEVVGDLSCPGMWTGAFQSEDDEDEFVGACFQDGNQGNRVYKVSCPDGATAARECSLALK